MRDLMEEKKRKRKDKEFNYRNNAISGRENEYISTGNNSWALPFHSFFDCLNVPEIPQTKASVCLLFRQAPSCGVQQQ